MRKIKHIMANSIFLGMVLITTPTFGENEAIVPPYENPRSGKPIKAVKAIKGKFVAELSDLDDQDQNEALCLAITLYHEARGLNDVGMKAVGHVVLNRKKDPHYPKTICSVVAQKGQFDWMKWNWSRIVPKRGHDWEISQKTAITLIRSPGEDMSHGALFFAVAGRPQRGHIVARIGSHVFRGR